MSRSQRRLQLRTCLSAGATGQSCALCAPGTAFDENTVSASGPPHVARARHVAHRVRDDRPTTVDERSPAVALARVLDAGGRVRAAWGFRSPPPVLVTRV